MTAALTIGLHIPQHESREALRVPANESPAENPQLGQHALKDIILIDYLNDGESSPPNHEVQIQHKDDLDSVVIDTNLGQENREPTGYPKLGSANQYNDLYIAPPPEVDLPLYKEFIAIARCESELRWDINTGNGYFGGLQFSQESWEGVGGLQFAPRADLATPYEQIVVAHELEEVQTLKAWPACSDKLNLI